MKKIFYQDIKEKFDSFKSSTQEIFENLKENELIEKIFEKPNENFNQKEGDVDFPWLESTIGMVAIGSTLFGIKIFLNHRKDKKCFYIYERLRIQNLPPNIRRKVIRFFRKTNFVVVEFPHILPEQFLEKVYGIYDILLENKFNGDVLKDFFASSEIIELMEMPSSKRIDAIVFNAKNTELEKIIDPETTTVAELVRYIEDRRYIVKIYDGSKNKEYLLEPFSRWYTKEKYIKKYEVSIGEDEIKKDFQNDFCKIELRSGESSSDCVIIFKKGRNNKAILIESKSKSDLAHGLKQLAELRIKLLNYFAESGQNLIIEEMMLFYDKDARLNRFGIVEKPRYMTSKTLTGPAVDHYFPKNIEIIGYHNEDIRSMLLIAGYLK